MSLLKARIAPTPSGFLHEGNLLAFLVQEKLAGMHGALLGLRIDDLDRERYREAYLEDIFRCLRLLDIRPRFGPKDADDFHLHYRQELRLQRYLHVLDELRDKKFVYACRCSRKEIESHPNTGCPSGCRNAALPLDAPGMVWRLQVPEGATVRWHDGFLGGVSVDVSDSMHDVVLRRRDGLPAYQVTSLTDDQDMGITLMVRGRDLVSSTAVQQWLAEALWGPSERIFYHHPLITAGSGEKLSKSAGTNAAPRQWDADAIRALRAVASDFISNSKS